MRQGQGLDIVAVVEVSIHAPREGCDYRLRGITRRPLRFNSRTPGGVRRVRALTPSALDVKFQFTHPGRGATRTASSSSLWRVCFNSRTPGGVRHSSRPLQGDEVRFQFTHPGRGATPCICTALRPFGVSIHAPREGCDVFSPFHRRESH